MKIPLRVLIVEDSEDDRELILLELRRGNYAPDYLCVDTPEAMQSALESGEWDIILSDYSMPKFNGLTALRMAKAKDYEIPFIIISGTIGEEIAVMAMKSGAQDYIMKGNLQRLVPAVERELKEYEIRKQRREALAELEESRTFFMAAMDNSAAGIIIAAAPDGKLLYVNEAALMIRGGDYKSLVEGLVIDEYVERWQTYDLDGNPLHTDEIPLAYALKFGEKNSKELIVKRDNGEDRIVLANASPIKNEVGNVYAAIIVFTDITEFRKTDLKLKRNEILLNMMGKTAKIGGWEFDPRTMEMMWTEEVYHIHEVDLSFDHSVQKGISFYAPGSKEIIEAAVAKCIEFGEPYDLELEFITAKGNHRWVNSIGKAHYENGKITKIYGSFQDITERKLLEIERLNAQNELLVAKEKAEAMSRLKSHFLANMSHELRTPLNGILGYADILSEKLDDPELSNMAQGIYNSGKRLSETLNLILDFSVAEADKIEVFPQDIKFVPVVESCIEQFSENLERKNLILTTQFPDEDIYSSLDERLFKRIVYNLIDNAIKFTQTGGILVKVVKEDIEGTPWAVLQVKDTGIGIKEENFHLIYEDFRQVSEGISRNYEGTGLGLTITKKTVELMGGIISVESNIGEGSTFTVKFPGKQNPLLAKNRKKLDNSTQPADSTEQKFPVALYIEDDPINRDVMVMFLKKTCQVDTAGSAEAALNMATSKRYDLILVDINLGESMSGMEVVKLLLTMPDYCNTPIIAVTAYSMGNERSEFLRGGCTHYLAKPFRKRELIDLVESILL